jgi:hypothetical protein
MEAIIIFVAIGLVMILGIREAEKEREKKERQEIEMLESIEKMSEQDSPF